MVKVVNWYSSVTLTGLQTRRAGLSASAELPVLQWSADYRLKTAVLSLHCSSVKSYTW